MYEIYVYLIILLQTDQVRKVVLTHLILGPCEMGWVTGRVPVATDFPHLADAENKTFAEFLTSVHPILQSWGKK